MQRRRQFLIEGGLGALSLTVLPHSSRAQPSPAPDRTVELPVDDPAVADLERLIPGLMGRFNIPGVSVAIVKDAKLHWRKGFGFKSRTSKAPVDHDTVFEAASISKTVFAYAVMKLCESGTIGLDTPLTRYTAQPFLLGDSRLEQITPRHVLSHTTGFQDWRSGSEPIRIHFQPGTRFRYSGEGYFYLQSVVTQLTGRVNRKECASYEAGLEVCATDIDDYLKSRLLVPFGMRASGYVWNDTFEIHSAQPHDGAGKPFAKAKPTASNAARYAAAGGLHTTPTDYAKFLIEILDPKSADDHRLNRASLVEMLRPQVTLDRSAPVDGAGSWALGWAVRERAGGNCMVHSGGQAGFQCLTVVSRERKSGFIIMTNSDNGWKLFHDGKFVETTDRLFAG